MIEILIDGLRHVDRLLLAHILVVLILVWGLVRVFNDGANPIEWFQLVASKTADGIVIADIDKLGKLIGVLIGSWVMVWDAAHNQASEWEFALYLLFISGVSVFSAWARSIVEHRLGTSTPAPISKTQGT